MALGHVEERVSTGPHGAGFRENGRMSRTSTHIFRVRLRPRVHREIEIPSETSLHDLAAAIVRAFDFDLDQRLRLLQQASTLSRS